MAEKLSFSERALKYAQGVTSGEIPACEYIKLAGQRFLDDLKRDDIVLTESGEDWCEFLEKLPHVKGEWARRKELFVLSDWQVFATVNIYGWKLLNGSRRFRDVYIEVPRKNGKTFWVAGLGLGHLTIDDEPGAEVYCGATTEKQAWEVFKPARLIARSLPDLQSAFGLGIHAKTISKMSDGSIFEPVIGNPGDGASPSCGIVDEFHEHTTSDLADTFMTGMGARRQPLMLQITTAGSDTSGPCYHKRVDAIKVLKKTEQDDSVFALIYTLDEGDDWTTEEAQRKANPNYGVSVNPEFLKGQVLQAMRSATKQATYKTKHLNIWVGAKQAWLNMLAVQACRKNISMDSFKGRSCYVALDLATKKDIASVCILITPTSTDKKYTAFFKHYLPEDRILSGDNNSYQGWHAEGWLTSTPGNVLDFQYIKDDITELKKAFNIVEVPFDPFQATQFASELIDEGYPMIEYGATVRNFSEPMKMVESLILSQQIQFDKDPVAYWMLGNVVAKEDAKENIFPRKEKPENKIDGAVALIMAMGRAMIKAKKAVYSIYNEAEL